MDGYKHRFEIQVRFNDVDMMGHVNHANYLSYVELARLKYYDDVLGPATDWHTQNGLIMARSEVDYRAPLHFDDIVCVYTRCSKLGTKSFELSWIVCRKNNDAEEPVAEGKTVIVCYDYALKQTREIPAERRTRIRNYELSAGNVVG